MFAQEKRLIAMYHKILQFGKKRNPLCRSKPYFSGQNLAKFA
jgi:hypothetical protein